MIRSDGFRGALSLFVLFAAGTSHPDRLSTGVFSGHRHGRVKHGRANFFLPVSCIGR